MEGQQKTSIYKYFVSHWFRVKVNYLGVVTHGIWASFIFSFLTNSGTFVVYTWMLIDPPDLTGSSLNSFTKFIL